MAAIVNGERIALDRSYTHTKRHIIKNRNATWTINAFKTVTKQAREIRVKETRHLLTMVEKNGPLATQAPTRKTTSLLTLALVGELQLVVRTKTTIANIGQAEVASDKTSVNNTPTISKRTQPERTKHIIHSPDPDHISVDLLCGTATRPCNASECYGYMGTSDEVTKCITGKISEDLPSTPSGTIIFEIPVEHKKEHAKEVDIHTIANIPPPFEMAIASKISKS